MWTYAWSAVRDLGPTYVVAPPDRLDGVAAIAGPAATLDGRDGLPAVLARILEPDASGANQSAADPSAADCAGVLLHDADRPGAPAALAAAVVAELDRGTPVCVPTQPVVETLKEVDPDGYVVRTLPRDGLSHLQTPAGLSRAALAEVLPIARPTADIADLVRLALGAHPTVALLPGDPRNLRITGLDQLGLAEATLSDRPPSSRSANARSSG